MHQLVDKMILLLAIDKFKDWKISAMVSLTLTAGETWWDESDIFRSSRSLQPK